MIILSQISFLYLISLHSNSSIACDILCFALESVEAVLVKMKEDEYTLFPLKYVLQKSMSYSFDSFISINGVLIFIDTDE